MGGFWREGWLIRRVKRNNHRINGYFAKLAFLRKAKAAEKFYHRYMSDILRIKFQATLDWAKMLILQGSLMY